MGFRVIVWNYLAVPLKYGLLPANGAIVNIFLSLLHLYKMEPKLFKGEHPVSIEVRLHKYFLNFHNLIFNVDFPLIKANFAELGERDDEKISGFDTHFHLTIKKLEDWVLFYKFLD